MAVLGTFQAQDRTIQPAATALARTRIKLTVRALMSKQRVRQTPVAPMPPLEALFEPGAGVSRLIRSQTPQIVDLYITARPRIG